MAKSGDHGSWFDEGFWESLYLRAESSDEPLGELAAALLPDGDVDDAKPILGQQFWDGAYRRAETIRSLHVDELIESISGLETDDDVIPVFDKSFWDGVDERALKVREFVANELDDETSSEGVQSEEPAMLTPIPLADDLRNEARLLRLEGELERAADYFQRALTVTEETLGSDDPTVARDLSNLAMVLVERGYLTTGFEHFRRALAIDEAAYGPLHARVAADLSNLARVQHALGSAYWVGARTNLERALAIDEALLGPNHSNVAIDLSRLAALARDDGDRTTAQKHLERALAIDEALFGPTHPQVAADLRDLALVEQDHRLGTLPLAKTHLERALSIDESVYGPAHTVVAVDLCNLAGILRDLGLISPSQARTTYLTAAKAHLERALSIDLETYGSDHPEVADDLNNLAIIRRDLGLDRDTPKSTRLMYKLREVARDFVEHGSASGE